MPSANRTISRAVAFIDAHAGLDITIEDVASAAGVTTRAVQLAFRRHLDATPTDYMRQLRVAHAHRQLQDAARGDTVTRIALDWGFANPGRFAAYYRAAYGRRPHETLRS